MNTLPTLRLLLCFLASLPGSLHAQAVGLPHDQRFDRLPTGTGLGEGWTQSTTDERDWTVHMGTTSSGLTGPLDDSAPTCVSGRYAYFEVSSPTVPMDTAELLSPDLDLTGATSPVVQLDYHMWGPDIGTLSIDAWDGAAYVNLLSLVGQQQPVQADPWRTTARLPLPVPPGAITHVRIRGLHVGPDVQGDMAIDNVRVFDADSPDVEVASIDGPASGSTAAFVSITLRNLSQQPSDPVPLELSVLAGPEQMPVTEVAPSIPAGATVSYSFATPVNLGSPYCRIEVRTLLPGDDHPENDAERASFTAPVSVFPYVEDFEPVSTCGTCEPGATLAAGWVQEAVLDQGDWGITSGTTPTPDTGPIGAETRCFEGNYAYFETSAPVAAGGEGHYLSPELDLALLTSPTLQLDYYLFGADTGDLHIEAWQGASYVTLHTILGQQQTTATEHWHRTPPLSLAGLGGVTHLRLRGVHGGPGAHGDIAVDNVRVFDGDLVDAGVHQATVDGSGRLHVFLENPSQVATGAFEVSFGIPGSRTDIREFVPSLPPATTLPFVFATPGRALANQVVEVRVHLAGDADASNDRTYTYVPKGWPSLFDGSEQMGCDRLPTYPGWTASDAGGTYWISTGTSGSVPLDASGDPDGMFLRPRHGSVGEAWLVSDPIHFAPGEVPMLSFHTATVSSGIDIDFVVDLFDGATFVPVASATFVGRHPWTAFPAIPIDTFGSPSTVRIRTVRRSPGTAVLDSVRIDTVTTETGIVELQFPSRTLPASSTVQPSVTLRSSSVVSGVELGLRVDGPIPAPRSTETLLLPADESSYLFGSTLDLSVGGRYTLHLDLGPDEDVFRADNRLSAPIIVIPIQALPYEETVEDWGGELPAGWVQSPSANRDWRVHRGNTATPATGPQGDASPAADGHYLYFETSGVTAGETAELVSPSLDLATSTDPVLAFSYHMHGIGIGDLVVEVDDGTSATQVLSISGQQQAGIGSPWKRTPAIPLSGFGWPIQVRIRAVHAGTAHGDIAIDDLRFFDASTNVGVTALDQPRDGCTLSASESISVTVTNDSNLPVVSVPISLEIRGVMAQGPFSETVPMIPASSSISYTFAASADLSQAGSYEIAVQTALPGDTDASDDAVVVRLRSGSAPVCEDWESGASGWKIAGGGYVLGSSSPSLERGSNQWAVNGANNYDESDVTWVESPDLPLCDFTNVELELDLDWATDSTKDGGLLEYSIDGGLSWLPLDAPGGTHWFTSLAIPALGGSPGWSGSSCGWQRATLDASVLAGQTARLRMRFQADAFGRAAGLAFDNLVLREPGLATTWQTGPSSPIGVVGIEGARNVEMLQLELVATGGSDLLSSLLVFPTGAADTRSAVRNLSVWLEAPGTANGTIDAGELELARVEGLQGNRVSSVDLDRPLLLPDGAPVHLVLAYDFSSVAAASGVATHDLTVLAVETCGDQTRPSTTPTGSAQLVGPPSCLIAAPSAGSSVGGETTVTFAAMLGTSFPVDATFEYSTDGGASWRAATAAPSSPLPNPAPGQPAPATGLTFVWDSATDGLGLLAAQPVDFRVSIALQGAVSTCGLDLTVDNRPTCSLDSPATGTALAGNATITWSGLDPTGDALTSSVEWTSDGGATWNLATAASGSPTMNPDVGRASPFVGATFLWDTANDLLGVTAADVIDLRVTIGDGIASTTCSASGITVDNRAACILLSPVDGASAGGHVPLLFAGFDPSADPLTTAFDFSPDGGLTWLPATPAATSALSNPDPMRPSPFAGVVFRWDSAADGIGLGGSEAVDLRIHMEDGRGTSADCLATMVTVDNRPTCSVVAPLAGMTVGGNVPVLLDAADPSDDLVSARVEFTTDGGASWNLATAAASSPVSNPTPPRATPFSGLGFTWDSAADALGTTTPQAADLRVILSDVSGAQSTCAVAGLTVDNALSCAISSPSPTATVAGEVAVTFSGTDAAADPLTSTFEFSTDGGATWSPATAAGSSALGNPDPGRASPFAGVTFTWDSAADALGLGGGQPVTFRVTVDDGQVRSTCSVDLTVNNQLACTITAPVDSASVAGEVDVVFDATHPGGGTVTVLVEHSTDGGVTWRPCATAASSPLANPSPPLPTPLSAGRLVWDSAADGLGLTATTDADLRVTIADATTLSSTCRVRWLSVANRPSCAIALPAVGSAVAGSIAITFGASDPGLDLLTSTVEFSTDAGTTWSIATADAASPLANPDLGRATPFAGETLLWDSQADGVGLAGAMNVDLRVRVDDGRATASCTSIGHSVDNVPGCLVTSPAPGVMAAGDVLITYDAFDLGGDPLSTTFEFSTDGGATYAVASASTMSPTPSPDPLRATPIVGRVFAWDTQLDGVGLAGATNALFRVTVDDGWVVSSCSVAMVVVDNVPSCTITAPAPAAVVSGEASFTFDGDNPSGLPLTSAFDYSTDGGITWFAATAGFSSPTANPDVSRPAPFAGARFIWDTQADALGLAAPQPAFFRVTVDNGYSASTCSQMVTVENAPSCSIVSPGPGASAAGALGITFDADDPSSDPLTSSFDYSLDAGATWQAATPAAASMVGNPHPGSPTPILGLTFVWDTVADGVGTGAPESTLFRVTVDDGFTTSSCNVSMLMVDNVPTCAISAPPGGAMVADVVDIVFDGASPSGSPLASTFEFSTDAGATWAPATAALRSPLANPDPARPSPFSGVVFAWDTAADAVGLGGSASTFFRVAIDDGAGMSHCSVLLDVDNQPTCTLAAPLPGATVTGDVDVVFDAIDPSNDAVETRFETSTDGGVTWQPATAAASSPVTNPDPPRATPFAGLTFTWDSATDVPTPTIPAATLVRAVVSDGLATSTCTVDVVVDNTNACPTACGDCNGDGTAANVLDALAAGQLVAGVVVPTPAQTACCDVDSSGTLTILDALAIAQADVGLMVTLSCP